MTSDFQDVLDPIVTFAHQAKWQEAQQTLEEGLLGQSDSRLAQWLIVSKLMLAREAHWRVLLEQRLASDAAPYRTLLQSLDAFLAGPIPNMDAVLGRLESFFGPGIAS
jgi:hypothetical protein